ncbi:Amyloid beta A4 precursor protein-binding family B member 1-interacting protein, partial [Galemys pyrenaicus]
GGRIQENEGTCPLSWQRGPKFQEFIPVPARASAQPGVFWPSMQSGAAGAPRQSCVGSAVSTPLPPQPRTRAREEPSAPHRPPGRRPTPIASPPSPPASPQSSQGKRYPPARETLGAGPARGSKVRAISGRCGLNAHPLSPHTGPPGSGSGVHSATPSLHLPQRGPSLGFGLACPACCLIRSDSGPQVCSKMGESNEDIDQMFSNLLGEMDLLTQSLGVDTLPPPEPKPPRAEFNYSVGFKDLNESLNALEDQDLDALMAELVADISEAEQRTIEAQKKSSQNQLPSASLEVSTCSGQAPLGSGANVATISISQYEDDLPPPPDDPVLDLPLPPPPPEPLSPEEAEAQAKADKIKLALEKLKEAKVKKLVVKVHMNDSSTKSLMVDERQLARDVLDNLFEKTHCDYNVDWCLYEIYPELQIERFFEDHENVVEVLSDWTRDTENKVLFLEKEEKYSVFKNPQNFYLDNKGKKESKEANEKMNAKNKESLLEESFCGTSVIVPELEGALYLKEDGKKSWKRRYFLLRASGIYYVPKGKTKTSRDLACFIQFENVNIYYGIQCKMKYKAPTDYCFVLKTKAETAKTRKLHCSQIPVPVRGTGRYTRSAMDSRMAVCGRQLSAAKSRIEKEKEVLAAVTNMRVETGVAVARWLNFTKNLPLSRHEALSAGVAPGPLLTVHPHQMPQWQDSGFWKQLGSGLLPGTGLLALNQVPLRGTHQKCVLLVSSKGNISPMLTSRSPINPQHQDGEIFGTEKEKHKMTEQRQVEEEAVDSRVLPRQLQGPLCSMFALTHGIRPPRPHPQIQKESQYIKYLCCDDARTLNHMERPSMTTTNGQWRRLGSPLAGQTWEPPVQLHLVHHLQANGQIPQANGQIPQATKSVNAVLQETPRHMETTKDKRPAPGNDNVGALGAHHHPKSSLPPPPPVRRSSDIGGGQVTPSQPQGQGAGSSFPPLSDDALPPPPPPPVEDELPPPPPLLIDEPPDFVPPPPPSFSGDAGSSLPPPPPPPPTLDPQSSKAPPIAVKRPPVPPKRHENPGPPGAGGGGEQDFMSDLMKALQKKRGNMS